MSDDELNKLLKKLKPRTVGDSPSPGLIQSMGEVITEFLPEAAGYIMKEALSPKDCFGVYFHDSKKSESIFAIIRTSDAEKLKQIREQVPDGPDKKMFEAMLKRDPCGLLRVFAIYEDDGVGTCCAFRVSMSFPKVPEKDLN